MGVGKYTPNASIQGDTGMEPPIVNQYRAITRQICRFSKMDNNRINKKIYLWSIQAAKKGCKNSLYHVLKKIEDINRHGDFENMETGLDDKWCVKTVSDGLMEQFTEQWQKIIMNETGTSKKGRNKLRTYRKFKCEFETELYISAIMPRGHRSAFAKFRTGTAPLKIETGRYEGKKECERICPFCSDSVEDEVHVMMVCPMYEDIREECESKSVLLDISPKDASLSDMDRFICWFSSSNEQFVRCLAKTCHDILRRRRCILYDM